jgi:hypothetical protein
LTSALAFSISSSSDLGLQYHNLQYTHTRREVEGHFAPLYPNLTREPFRYGDFLKVSLSIDLSRYMLKQFFTWGN